MTIGIVTYRILIGLTVLAYAVVVTGPGRVVQESAGGVTLFDLAIFGYDVEHAARLMTALGAEGIAHYRDWLIPADLAFAGLFTLALGLTGLRLAVGMEPPLPTAMAAVCALPGLCDIAENLAVAVVLAGDAAAPDAGAVARASLLTQAKWASLALAVLTLGALFWRLRMTRNR